MSSIVQQDTNFGLYPTSPWNPHYKKDLVSNPAWWEAWINLHKSVGPFSINKNFFKQIYTAYKIQRESNFKLNTLTDPIIEQFIHLFFCFFLNIESHLKLIFSNH